MEYLLEYAMNIVEPSEEMIGIEHIAGRVEEIEEEKDAGFREEIQPLNEAVALVEMEIISRAVAATEGNVSKAAKLLEIPRQTLQRKITQYGIDTKKRP